MYDAIVVGARCGGSPTAMLLARKGYKALLVDRATFPSDSMRNHYIRHKGVVQLHKWGLLDRIIESGCPPLIKHTVDLGDFPLGGYAPPGDGVIAEYGPRRYILDKILVDAAAEAGVEVREGFSVQELLMEDGRVVGIKGKAKGGSVVTERARMVVGADGQHSMVARGVDAKTYSENPATSCGYFSYFSRIDCEGIEVYMRDQPAFMLAFATHNGLTCVATQVPIEQFPGFRADIEKAFLERMELAPELAERVRNGKREEKFFGSADLPGFFRKPYGPGWALVGDAGYHKDPITARGISDAFRDAELLAEAIDAGFSGQMPLEEAMAEYERVRNEAAMPSYNEACESAAFKPIPPMAYKIREAVRGNQVEIDRMMGVTGGTVPADEFYSPENIQRILREARK
ncbi:MAG: NAD(P)/FAD-dependent oxidoreductase [Chloroflexia bacterium]